MINCIFPVRYKVAADEQWNISPELQMAWTRNPQGLSLTRPLGTSSFLLVCIQPPQGKPWLPAHGNDCPLVMTNRWEKWKQKGRDFKPAEKPQHLHPQAAGFRNTSCSFLPRPWALPAAQAGTQPRAASRPVPSRRYGAARLRSTGGGEGKQRSAAGLRF